VCGPFTGAEYDAALRADADVFVGHADALAKVLSSPSKLSVHVEFDTGMSRQGFRPEDADAIARQMLARKELLAGVCMHFANVEDVFDHDYARAQLARFGSAVKAFRNQSFGPFLSHAASSASALILPESEFDLERVGISLYGFWPSPATRLSYSKIGTDGAKSVDLRPVLSWRTRVTSVIPVRAGQFIGYGCTYRANHDMRVAVLPIGYFEGYPRAAGGSSSYILLRGQRCPIVGRICMNMLMIDVTHLEGLGVGEVATLIGTDGSETISAADLATWAGTIHYEIVTRLNPEIPRRTV